MKKKRIWIRRRDRVRQRYWVGRKLKRQYGSKIPYRIEYLSPHKNRWEPAFKGELKPGKARDILKEIRKETEAPSWRIIREDLEKEPELFPGGGVVHQIEPLDVSKKGEFFKLRGLRNIFGKVTDVEGIASRDDIEKMKASRIWDIKKIEPIEEPEFKKLKTERFSNFGWSEDYPDLYLKDIKEIASFDLPFSELAKTRDVQGWRPDKKLIIDLDKLKEEEDENE